MTIPLSRNFFLSKFSTEPLSLQKKAKTALFAEFGLLFIHSLVHIYIVFFSSVLDTYFAYANMVFILAIILAIIFMKSGKYYPSVMLVNITYVIVISVVFFRCLYVDVLLAYNGIIFIIVAQLSMVSFFGNNRLLLSIAFIYFTECVIYYILAQQSIAPAQSELLAISFVSSNIMLFLIVIISILMKKITEDALKKAETEADKNIKQYEKIRELNKKITYAHEEVLQTSIRLAAEKERLDITLRSIGEGVISTDTMGRIVIFSAMAETITGIEARSTIGKKIYDLPLYAILSEGITLEKVISSGEVFEKEMVITNKKGEALNVVVKGAPVKDYDFGIIGAVIILSDVTERSRMLEELHKTSKIESLGVFAGGIAHDFNNLLTAVLGNISIALHHNSDQRQASVLSDAENACLRAQELTHQLLTFSQGGAPVRKVTSVGKLLFDTCQFVLSGSRIECNYNIPDDLWNAEIDAGQVSQVIHNLVLNSIQAMDENGRLDISAENSTGAGSGVQDSDTGAKRYVKIIIRDNGCGIDKNDLAKIYDPYFTTKENGSGLGLAIVYSIIKKHGGHIEVKSDEGPGTTFMIYLPGSEGEFEEFRASDIRNITFHGRILIMDDEKLVIKVLENMLKQLGFEVFSVSSGEDAIELYSHNFDRDTNFEAVIMDITIPGKMGGLETIGHLRKINPTLKAIVSSGYSNNPVMAEFEKYGFNGVLTKPYNIEELRKVIAQVLFDLH